MNRRGFLIGLAAGIAAPAIVRPGILMPIKKVLVPEIPLTLNERSAYGFWIIKGFDAYGNPIQEVVPKTNITAMTWTDAYKKFKQVGTIISPDGFPWSNVRVDVNTENVVYHAGDVVSINSEIKIAGE